MLNGSFGTCIWEGFNKFGDLIDEPMFTGEALSASRDKVIKISYLLILPAVPLRQAQSHPFQVSYRRVRRKMTPAGLI